MLHFLNGQIITDLHIKLQIIISIINIFIARHHIFTTLKGP